MIILQTTALSQNFWVALLEALLLLAVAAYVGWWIARRMLETRINGLQADIQAKKIALDDCRRAPIVTPTTFDSGRLSVAAVVTAVVPIISTPDDLKLVEGIGPKIEALLNQAGITTFAQLANSAADSTIKPILDQAGPRFQMHDPTTWPQQAALARDGKWDELKTWQDELYKGRPG